MAAAPQAAPNLVIQLQRMGDLVLSFPLFSWLIGLEPHRPLWVVAEPGFFKALMPLAPSVVFFPPEAEPQLRFVLFRRVINLSHRPEAARLAGAMQAEIRLGQYQQNSVTHVEGNWHLYRSSLVHNNRHNLLHWADLNALDAIPPRILTRSGWPVPRPPTGSGRVGLFVGASTPAKHPDPEFWGDLAAQLVQRGCKPVFLGGTSERALGAKAAALAKMPQANLCGRFNLAELVQFLAELDLLITPDTGPMHVGAWGGTLTLNLSMGPVNAWETAPFPPGHLVLRSTASCTGCWQCLFDQPRCKRCFTPSRVASLVHGLLRADSGRPPVLPGLGLMRTTRSPQGLFELVPALSMHLENTPADPDFTARYALGDFWRQWFLSRLGGPPPLLDTALTRMHAVHPRGLELLQQRLPRWQAKLTAAVRQRSLPSDFWLQAPPLLRPLSGYLQLFLENSSFSRPSWLTALGHIENLAQTLR